MNEIVLNWWNFNPNQLDRINEVKEVCPGDRSDGKLNSVHCTLNSIVDIYIIMTLSMKIRYGMVWWPGNIVGFSDTAGTQIPCRFLNGQESWAKGSHGRILNLYRLLIPPPLLLHLSLRHTILSVVSDDTNVSDTSASAQGTPEFIRPAEMLY